MERESSASLIPELNSSMDYSVLWARPMYESRNVGRMSLSLFGIKSGWCGRVFLGDFMTRIGLGLGASSSNMRIFELWESSVSAITCSAESCCICSNLSYSFCNFFCLDPLKNLLVESTAVSTPGPCAERQDSLTFS